MKSNDRRAAFAKYIVSLLLFGCNGIVASHIALSSYLIVLLRTMIGSLLLLMLFLLCRGRFTFYKHRRPSLFLAASGVSMGASWMFLYEAYSRLGVSVASLIYYCGPVIVMALSPVLFKERLTALKLIGFLAVLCGIVLVNGNPFGAGGDLFGVFCGLMSAVTYAMMVIFNKKAKEITGLENATLQLLVSFGTVAVFVGLKQGFALPLEPGDVLPALLLGLVNTGFGCYLFFSSIGRLPVQTVAICGYLEPLSAVLLSVLLLREAMLPAQIVGAVLIIGGAVWSECAGLIRRESIVSRAD